MKALKRGFAGTVCLLIWLLLSGPLLVRWFGVEVPLRSREVGAYAYFHQGKPRVAYKVKVTYEWGGRFYEREFQIDKSRFYRLQQRERLKVAFLPIAPSWQPILGDEFRLWTDRAVLPFLGFLLNVGFWGTILYQGRN